MLYISAYCAFTVFILLVTAHHPTSLNTRFRYLKKSLKDCMFPVRIYTLNVFADFNPEKNSGHDIHSQHSCFAAVNDSRGFRRMCIIIQFIIFLTPISRVLHIVSLGFNEVFIIIILNIIAFLFIEILKPIISKKFED